MDKSQNIDLQVYFPFQLVAQFADGARLIFGGVTEEQATDKMEAAQAQHGDIYWYDGVTDAHYENGQHYATIQAQNGTQNSK